MRTTTRTLGTLHAAATNNRPPLDKGGLQGGLADRTPRVATSRQKTDSPPSTFVEDEHSDEHNFKGNLQWILNPSQ